MKHRILLAAAATILAFSVAGCRRRPRGLLLFVFDAGAATHFGCYGDSRGTTPTVDALARQGVAFRSFFATAPYTASSFASMFTSRYPLEHRVLAGGDVLDERFPTAAGYFRSQGFATAGFADNPFLRKEYGFARGFETWVEYDDRSRPDAPARIDVLLSGVDRALAGNVRRPLFLFVHVLRPHAPYHPPADLARTFIDPSYRGTITGSSAELFAVADGRRRVDGSDVARLVDLYDANLRYGDGILAMVLERLQRAGRLAETDVVVTSDHGEGFGEHGVFLHDVALYDELIHVPLVVRRAGARPKADPDALGDGVDLLPTLAAIEGLPPLAGAVGRSLLTGGGKAHVLSYAHDLRSVALRTRAEKYIRHQDGREELYRLDTDPGEKRNLAASAPAGSREADLARAELAAYPHGRSGAAPRREISSETASRLLALGYLAPSSLATDTPLPPEGFRARYRVVSAPRALSAGRGGVVAVEVANAGTRPWSSQGRCPIRLGCHWADTAGHIVRFEGPRAAFALPLSPGQSARVEVSIEAPDSPGTYRLELDLVQENVAWFSSKGVAPASVDIRVEAAPPSGRIPAEGAR